jgi:hypothetical protein
MAHEGIMPPWLPLLLPLLLLLLLLLLPLLLLLLPLLLLLLLLLPLLLLLLPLLLLLMLVLPLLLLLMLLSSYCFCCAPEEDELWRAHAPDHGLRWVLAVDLFASLRPGEDQRLVLHTFVAGPVGPIDLDGRAAADQ